MSLHFSEEDAARQQALRDYFWRAQGYPYLHILPHLSPVDWLAEDEQGAVTHVIEAKCRPDTSEQDWTTLPIEVTKVRALEKMAVAFNVHVDSCALFVAQWREGPPSVRYFPLRVIKAAGPPRPLLRGDRPGETVDLAYYVPIKNGIAVIPWRNRGVDR